MRGWNNLYEVTATQCGSVSEVRIVEDRHYVLHELAALHAAARAGR